MVFYIQKEGEQMTQGERVRVLRKEKNLTLEKFGESLGVGKTAISKIENNERGLTDQMILAICREYNANEEWLRTGSGEMFVPLSRDDEIAFAVGKLIQEDDSFKKKLISILLKMDESQWEVLEQIANELIKKD